MKLSHCLSGNFRYWESNWKIENEKLIKANEVIKTYYYTNKRIYPESLSRVKLDITNLNSIARSLLYLSEAHRLRYKSITDIRNDIFNDMTL